MGARVLINGTRYKVSVDRLRALGVTPAERLDQLPNVRTIADTVSGFEVSGFLGLGAPKGTPVEVVTKLNDGINIGLADATLKTRLKSMGYTAASGTPSDFRKFLADETDKWSKVIRSRDIKSK